MLESLIQTTHTAKTSTASDAVAAAAAVSGGAHPPEVPAGSENAEVPQLETDTEGTVDPDTAATVYKVAGRGGMRELSCYIYIKLYIYIKCGHSNECASQAEQACPLCGENGQTVFYLTPVRIVCTWNHFFC